MVPRNAGGMPGRLVSAPTPTLNSAGRSEHEHRLPAGWALGSIKGNGVGPAHSWGGVLCEGQRVDVYVPGGWAACCHPGHLQGGCLARPICLSYSLQFAL